jgi:hypothetical protein
MTSDLLLILMVLAHRRKTVPPEVCPKSFASGKNSAFRRRRHSILPRSPSQTAFSPAFHAHQKTLKRHSNRMSIPDTASFM